MSHLLDPPAIGGVMAENFAAQPGGPAGQVGLNQSNAPGVLAEYRLHARYRRPFLARFVLTGFFACLFTAAVAMSPHLDYGIIAGLVGVAALYNGIAYTWRGRFRTRVTRDGIEVRGYFNHFVPWSEIKAVREEGYGESHPLVEGYYDRQYRHGGGSRSGGSRSGGTTGRRARLGVVRIFRVRGKSIILRAPLVTAWAPDPHFEAKVRQMQELAGQLGSRPGALGPG
jgi:hypothetical protein